MKKILFLALSPVFFLGMASFVLAEGGSSPTPNPNSQGPRLYPLDPNLATTPSAPTPIPNPNQNQNQNPSPSPSQPGSGQPATNPNNPNNPTANPSQPTTNPTQPAQPTQPTTGTGTPSSGSGIPFQGAANTPSPYFAPGGAPASGGKGNSGWSDGINIINNQSGLSGKITAKELLKNILKWFTGVLAFLFMAAMVISGIIMIVSIGNQSMFDVAKKWLLYSILGLIIALLSFVAVSTIGGWFGLT